MFGFKKKKLEFEDLPENVQDELNMVEITLMEGGDPTETFKRISKKYPGFIPARLNLASTLLNSGNVTESRATYEKVLKDFPDEIGAIAGIATVLSATNEHEKAEKYALKALSSGYEWAPCYEVIAKAKENKGDKAGEAEAYLSGYRSSPHSWVYLEKYCKLTNQDFVPPTEHQEQYISKYKLESLISTIENLANTPDTEGNIIGCDHTFRFTERWAKENSLDVIKLYQFLNANGGFCDCEVCYNVSQLLNENGE